MQKKTLITAFLILVTGLIARGNDTGNDVSVLKALLDSTYYVKDDSLRLKLNHNFYEQLYRFIADPDNKISSLDSLKITNVISDDGYIRILTWNIQQNNGDNIYAGIIIRKNPLNVLRLKIKKAEKSIPDSLIYKDGNWPGGLIYKIIQRKINSKTNFTLLSWDGFDRRTSRKSIESLNFDNQGNALFGAPVFKTKEGIKNRIVTEYSSNASFSLNYTRQKVILAGVRKSQRNIDDEIIVFDRLVPLNEELKGSRWAYVPVGNTHDAFIFFEGYWTLTEDIQARNKASVNTKIKKRKPTDLDLFQESRKKK